MRTELQLCDFLEWHSLHPFVTVHVFSQAHDTSDPPLSTLPEFGKVMLESLVVVPIGFLSAATSTKNPRLKYL